MFIIIILQFTACFSVLSSLCTFSQGNDFGYLCDGSKQHLCKIVQGTNNVYFKKHV